MYKTTSLAKAIYLLFIPLLITGCNSYKKVVELRPEAGSLSKSQYLKSLITREYYLILHHGSDEWHIKNLIENSNGIWNAEAEAADSAYIAIYRKVNSERVPKYHIKEKQYLHQAHVFINDSLTISSGKVNFNIATARIEILKPKRYASAFIGVAAFFGLIILLVNSVSFDFSK